MEYKWAFRLLCFQADVLCLINRRLNLDEDMTPICKVNMNMTASTCLFNLNCRI